MALEVISPRQDRAVGSQRKGVILARRHLGDALGCVWDAGDAIRCAPNSAAARWNRALAHLEREEPDQALADAEEAMRLDPSNPAGLRIRGRILAAMHKTQEARRNLERFLRVAPQDPAAGAVREMLESLDRK